MINIWEAKSQLFGFAGTTTGPGTPTGVTSTGTTTALCDEDMDFEDLPIANAGTGEPVTGPFPVTADDNTFDIAISTDDKYIDSIVIDDVVGMVSVEVWVKGNDQEPVSICNMSNDVQNSYGTIIS